MSVLFVTGAGISANAGIPVYREAGSSWTDPDLEKKSHATRYGNHLDELWDRHWGPIGKQMTEAEPTYTHRAIARFQETHEAIIATQNIDTLHEKAGSDNVAHLHGEMTAVCMRCKSKNIHAWLGVGAPNCADCNSRKTRPDVVLFGETLNKKMFAGIERFAGEVSHVIAVGTSLNVFPAAQLVFDHVSKSIIINKDGTVFDKWALRAENTDCDEIIDDVLEQVDRDLGT